MLLCYMEARVYVRVGPPKGICRVVGSEDGDRSLKGKNAGKGMVEGYAYAVLSGKSHVSF